MNTAVIHVRHMASCGSKHENDMGERMSVDHIRNKRSGFAMAEVVIGAALMVLTITMFLSSFVQAQKSAELVDERMKAVHFCRLNMETLLTNTYSSTTLNLTNRPNWITNYNIAAGITSLYFCSYSVVTSVYPTARIIIVSNKWYSTRPTTTNYVTVATAISSGFQY